MIISIAEKAGVAQTEVVVFGFDVRPSRSTS